MRLCLIRVSGAAARTPDQEPTGLAHSVLAHHVALGNICPLLTSEYQNHKRIMGKSLHASCHHCEMVEREA